MRPVQTRIVVRNAVASPVGQLLSGGFLKDSPGVSADPMRIYGSYALVYLLDGAGRYADSAGHACPVRPGDLILVFPELAHAYGPGPGQHWTEWHLTFRGPVFDLWRQAGLLDAGRPVLHLEPVEQWLGRLATFTDGPLPVTATGKAQEVSRFLTVLTDVLASGAGPEAEQDWLAQAIRLLESDLAQDVDPARVAARVGLSYETFRKRFAARMQISPARYRLARRIDVARELLTRTRMTNRQVAEELGFADEFHFSRRFTQITGQTPRQYRRDAPGRL